MARALEVNIAANTREFVSGTQDVAKSLDKVSDALDDVVKDGDKFERKVSDDLKDVAQEAKRSGKSIGSDMGDGFDKAKRGAEDFKQEAQSTAKESAASFDGSAESIGDAFQEVAANAFAGFGPAGAAAGLAAAVGIGLVTAEVQKQKEMAEELKEALTDAYKTAAEEGRTFLDETQIQALVLESIFDNDKRRKAQEESKILGVSVIDLLRAQAGDQEALNRVINAGKEAEQGRRDAIIEAQGPAGARYALADQELDKIKDITGQFETQLELQKELKQAAQLALNVERDRNAEAKQLGEALQKLPKTVSTKVDFDDFALRNYKPKTVRVPVEFVGRNGQRIQ